jgi:aminoglycoside phosphotransferase (APT) family kinase protein
VPERAGFGPGQGKDPEAARGAGRFIRQALEAFGDDMPPVFTRVGRLYVDHAAEILDLWDEGERTFIHGDAHLGNLMVDGEDGDRTGFYDWAMVSRSPGVRDVAYFCCNSVPTELRREMEAGLLADYRGALAGAGIELDAATAFDQYRLFSVYSWVSATSTAAVGSRWQPEAVGRGGMLRATTALEDLDAAGLLEERLG